MAAMQTTMIRASITAYSTAVGPSSRLRKFTTDEVTRASIFASRKGKEFEDNGQQRSEKRGGRDGSHSCSRVRKQREVGPEEREGAGSPQPIPGAVEAE